MKKLEEYFQEFHNITGKYEGKNTDWKESYYKLDKLYTKIKHLHIKTQKNYSFYIWIQDRLVKEISEEINRIHNKIK